MSDDRLARVTEWALLRTRELRRGDREAGFLRRVSRQMRRRVESWALVGRGARPEKSEARN